MSRFAPMHRPLAVLLLASYVPATTGCTSWRNQQGDVATVLAAQPRAVPSQAGELNGVPGVTVGQPDHAAPPQSIRISTAATANLELHSPRIINDSLFGSPGHGQPEIGIPLSNVTSIQVRETSSGKSVALGVGLAAGVLLIVGMVWASNNLVEGFEQIPTTSY